MKKDLFDLTGKVVLITGGSGHLGTAMSHALSQYNATLVLASRNHTNNQKLARKLRTQYGNEVMALEMDFANEENVEKAIKAVTMKHRQIHVLINNAYYGAGTTFHNMKKEDWKKGLDGSIINLFYIIQKVLNVMMVFGEGKIINIASMYGLVAPDVSIYEGTKYYNPANYGVGKASLIQLTKYLASVYAPYGITCNSISPGPFPQAEVQEDQEFLKRLEKKVPLGRVGQPEELKGIITLLASDASSFINGTNICVDGGWTAW